jgi:hypothetical protein
MNTDIYKQIANRLLSGYNDWEDQGLIDECKRSLYNRKDRQISLDLKQTWKMVTQNMKFSWLLSVMESSGHISHKNVLTQLVAQEEFTALCLCICILTFQDVSDAFVQDETDPCS